MTMPPTTAITVAATWPAMSKEQDKNQEVKDEPVKAEQVKEELPEDELDVVTGGKGVTEQSVNNWIGERIHFLDPSS